MLLESWELKENGLKREYDEVAGKVKFFAINPLPIIETIATDTAALPIEKSLPDETLSDAIASTDSHAAATERDRLSHKKIDELRKEYRKFIPHAQRNTEKSTKAEYATREYMIDAIIKAQA